MAGLSFLSMIVLELCLQGAAVTLPPPGCLTAAEEEKLSKEQKIDNRIKEYRKISERLHKQVESEAKNQRSETIPAILTCWSKLLTTSQADIEANVNRKKKSGALIDYEIQIRKSIVDMEDARLKASLQQQDDFASWLEQATAVREKFVDILFQR